LDNKEYFQNKSFTLSYSPIEDAFKSFHSYLPERVFYSNNTFFTTYDNKIWKHNAGLYQTYYGKTYPYIIEFVVRDFATFFTHAVHYFAKAFKYNTSTETYTEEDVTFDKMLVYTEKQSSGIVNLVLPINDWDNIEFSNTTKYVIEGDGDYKISQIRDTSIDTPTYSKHWDNISQYYYNR